MSQAGVNSGGGGGGGGIITIDGDIGSVTGSTVSINALDIAGATPYFSGSGTTLSFNIQDTYGNILIGLGTDTVTSISSATNVIISPSGTAGPAFTTATSNVGMGPNVFSSITSAVSNCAYGAFALNSATSASHNCCFGDSTLELLTTSDYNCAFGNGALISLATGEFNVAIGAASGFVYAGSESHNILLNSNGVVSESHVLRIGNATGTGQQELNSAYICGLTSNTQNPSSSVQVVTIQNSGGASPNLLGVTTVSVTGIVTIDGDVGSVTGSTVSILGVNSGGSVSFTSSSATELDLLIEDLNDNILLGNGTAAAGGTSSINIIIDNIGPNNGASFTTATQNIIIGAESSVSLTSGSSNYGYGVNTFNSLTTGGHNCAYGFGTLGSIVSGSYNTALGSSSGSNCTTSDSSNVSINNLGTSGESHALRIGAGTGTGNQQLSTAYISGINGNTVGSALMVTIDSSTDQLGTQAIPTPGALPWTDEGSNFNAAVGNGYFCEGIAASITATLPASPSQGNVVAIVADNAGTVIVQANTGQKIRLSSSLSTSAGNITNTSQGDSVNLVYRSSDTTWIVSSSIGNWIVN